MSNNALEFTSELFCKLCTFYNIKKCNIVAHKPSSNGLVERTNKKIIEILRTVISPKTTNWDWWLDDIQLAINNTVNSSTGETPHFLLYGEKGVCHLVYWMTQYSLGLTILTVTMFHIEPPKHGSLKL